MNFQGLSKIEIPDVYIDVAIKRAKKKGDESKNDFNKKHTRLDKSKIVELEKIKTLSINLSKPLERIIRSYPDIEALPEFYKQLINLYLEIELIKKSLGGVQWAKKRIEALNRDYVKKIKQSKELQLINKIRREFLGRVTSIIKQIKKELLYLEKARITMKKFPSIKTEIKTIAIAGFPNVGKSTLLSKLTGSTPEINNYAFTTKSLLIGYLKKSYNKLQLIDTPGTLNRIDKMNNIEILAHLAMRYVADNILFIFDLTGTYDAKDQIKLYKNILKFNKKTFCYLSKTDLIDKKIVKQFKEDHKAFQFMEFDEIKEMKGLI